MKRQSICELEERNQELLRSCDSFKSATKYQKELRSEESKRYKEEIDTYKKIIKDLRNQNKQIHSLKHRIQELEMENYRLSVNSESNLELSSSKSELYRGNSMVFNQQNGKNSVKKQKQRMYGSTKTVIQPYTSNASQLKFNPTTQQSQQKQNQRYTTQYESSSESVKYCNSISPIKTKDTQQDSKNITTKEFSLNEQNNTENNTENNENTEKRNLNNEFTDLEIKKADSIIEENHNINNNNIEKQQQQKPKFEEIQEQFQNQEYDDDIKHNQVTLETEPDSIYFNEKYVQSTKTVFQSKDYQNILKHDSGDKNSTNKDNTFETEYRSNFVQNKKMDIKKIKNTILFGQQSNTHKKEIKLQNQNNKEENTTKNTQQQEQKKNNTINSLPMTSFLMGFGNSSQQFSGFDMFKKSK